PGEGNAVVGVFGQAHAVAVRLHLLVRLAVRAGRLVRDPGEDARAGVARDDVGADAHRAEVVAVVEHARLHAVPALAVRAGGFAADVVPEAGGGHQVPLVGGVDEHLASVGRAAEGRDGRDAGAVFLDPPGPVEPLVADDGDLVLADKVLEHLLGDV